MIDNLFTDIGGKLKAFAKYSFIVWTIIDVLGGLIVFFIAMDDQLPEIFILLGLVAIILCPFANLAYSWLVYALGEKVDKLTEIECNTRLTTHKDKQIDSKCKKYPRDTPIKQGEQNVANTHTQLSNEENYINVTCPHCSEKLYYLENEIDNPQLICPHCCSKIYNDGKEETIITEEDYDESDEAPANNGLVLGIIITVVIIFVRIILW